MTPAYDRIYLESARASLARMLEFAVHDLDYDISTFFELFITSGIASSFANGDPSTVVGKSGVELTYDVLERCGVDSVRIETRVTGERSPEYWVGWALAYYQWLTARSFRYINDLVPIAEVLGMYTPYHEMDIRQFADKMDQLVHNTKSQKNLKAIRMAAGLSQRDLSVASSVPVRTIQQYEQGQKDINKARAEYLVMLSRALKCSPEDLLEET
ncbi:MAG: helix-turn-helix transcriptional regulator [Lachnospiraceae bacterium]|nr:helix-turn-helix transcriptional regulator [Lachnospiraceae bacterium]